MTHRSFLLAAGAALLLAGCGGTQNRGLESAHQPVVDPADYALDLGTTGGRLNPGEEHRLAGWLDGMRVGYGDQIALDDPSGLGGTARSQVGGVLSARGLMLRSDAPITASPVAPGTVRVVVSRMRATVAGCPDRSRDSSNEFDSHTSSNFGCATNTNLAAMVASPSDLVHGRDGQVVADPARSAKAINAYRSAVLGGGGGQTVKSESSKGAN